MLYFMAKTFIAVRDVDEETFRKFKAVSVEEKMKLGDAVTKAMQLWVETKKEREEKKPSNILKIKPVKIGAKKVNWSREVDKIVYND